MHARGQRVDIAFSGDEPLHDELRAQGKVAQLEALGVRFHALPYPSHTLKPAEAQAAANAILDEAVAQVFPPVPAEVGLRPRRVAASR
jgi:hypothetical protein